MWGVGYDQEDSEGEVKDGSVLAKLRAYERQVREKTLELERERKLRKRAEVEVRSITDELEEVTNETRSKVQAVRTDLKEAKQRVCKLEAKIEEQNGDLSQASRDKNRVNGALERTRETLQHENQRAEKATMDAKYHERRAWTLDLKCKQAKSANLALQFQVEQLQETQQEILHEMGRATSGGKRANSKTSSGDSASDPGPGSPGAFIKKSSKIIASRIGTLFRPKTGRFDGVNTTDGNMNRGDGNSGASDKEQNSSPNRATRRSPTGGTVEVFGDIGSTDSANVSFLNNKHDSLASYLESMEDGGRLKKLFKGKQLYFQSLALTRKDMARQEQVLNNLVKLKEVEIESLSDELEHEKTRNKILEVQARRERGRNRGEAKNSNGHLLRQAREELNLKEKRFHSTIFDWRE